MINASNYNSTMPDAVTASTPLTLIKTGASEYVRADLTKAANKPLEVITARESSKGGNVERKLIKFTQRYVSVDSTLNTETPYDVTANLTITADKRYVQAADLTAVLAGLLSWALSKEDAQADYNVIRVAKGEL